MQFLTSTTSGGGGDERAELVAENARRIFAGRYLTPASVACYWRRAIKGYASVLKFGVDVEGVEDYETFALNH
jgi:hypothetical protein